MGIKQFLANPQGRSRETRMPHVNHTVSTASDLLRGLPAIARHLGWTAGSTRYRVEAGHLPTFRVGRTICARRSSLAQWLAQAEGRAP